MARTISTKLAVEGAPVAPPSPTEIKPSKSNIPIGVIEVLAGIAIILISTGA